MTWCYPILGAGHRLSCPAHISQGMFPSRINLITLITRMASHRRLSLRVFVIPYNAEPAQFDILKCFDCDCLNLIVE